MTWEFLLHDIRVCNQYFHNGLCKPLHIPLPDFRIWTLQFGDYVETLG